MAEEEDPVEHEIDVYLSKSLAEKLYLLQYPVRPTFMTYDNSNHISARVKPKQKKVELEVGIDTRSQNYARSKGEQIALNVDGAARGTSGSYYTSDKMDKQLLSSVPSTDSSGRYAVGVYKEGELHLTPLHALVQLRPSFSFLDKADIKMKTDVGPGGDMGGESSQDEEEEAKPVTMKFARQETEEAKARRMASYNYLQKKQEEESWVPVQFHNIDDGISESERLHLISNRGDELSEFQLQPKEYLHMLIPPPDETQEEKPAMPSNVLSLTQLRTMPLPDQIKTLLTNAKVIRFAQLMALLPQGSDTMAALRSLQQVALLVQGCWVVKSEVLYPKEACSPHSGVSAEHLCRGRDYVMWRFTQSRHVTRKDIASIVKLPAEDVKEILEQISKIRVNCGWEFLFTHDSEFTNRYPDIVQRQKMLWNAKYQSLCKQLKIPKEHDKKFKEKEQSNPSTEKTGRQRRNSSRSPGTRRKRTLSGRSLSDYSDIKMDNLKSDQEVTIEDDDHAPRLDEPMEVNNTNHVSNGPSLSAKANLNCSISEVSIELKTELINFVQEKLISRFVLSASELRRLFLMKVTQCPPGHILGTGVSDKLLEETVLQVGGVQLENQWPPNVKEEPIFALPKTGDKLDPARTVLLNWFNKNYKITKKSFTKAVEDETGETMSDNDCKLLLKDYCQAKGIMWYLKGTSASS